MGNKAAYENDIFVSYAHVDDEKIPGIDRGWVSFFLDALRVLVSQHLGRRDAFRMWVDSGIRQYGELDQRVLDGLASSAALLAILSPGYLASEWCRVEREWFIRTHSTSSRLTVFLVELDPIDRSSFPTEFARLLSFRFWEGRGERGYRRLGAPRPDPERDRKYFDALNDVAEAIAEGVSAERGFDKPTFTIPGSGSLVMNPPPITNTSPVTTSAKEVIFLAESTDDLEQQRQDLRRYLRQFNYEVVPDVWYPRNANDFCREMREDLDRSSLFVQLLSGVPGKHALPLEHTYTILQYMEARRVEIPVLQWRDPNLDLGEVRNERHRRFLESREVMAIPLEEFKREVTESLLSIKATAEEARTTSNSNESTMVFVNSEGDDRAAALEICEALVKHGYAYALPAENGDPADVRQDLEDNLLECDALIVVYGQITSNWVRGQLRHWRKIAGRRSRPLRILAIYEGPPPGEKDSIGMMFPMLQVIDGRTGLADTLLQPIFAALERS